MSAMRKENDDKNKTIIIKYVCLDFFNVLMFLNFYEQILKVYEWIKHVCI